MFRADNDARGLQTHVYAMGAKIAFGRCVTMGIDIKRIVRAGLHARFAADAALVVKINDAVVAAKESDRGTNLDARRGIAMIATQDAEMTPGACSSMGQCSVL